MKVVSSGTPIYLTSIFSILPIVSRCLLASALKIAFLFFKISWFDKNPAKSIRKNIKIHMVF
jgi:hypothetical protein